MPLTGLRRTMALSAPPVFAADSAPNSPLEWC